jgi:hypothetical protein
LPNAKFDDARAANQTVNLQRTMTGVLYSYVKTTGATTLRLPFVLSRMKALELKEFIRVYYRAQWVVDLHDGTHWIAHLLSDPFDSTAEGRAEGWPGSEAIAVTLVLSAKPVENA